jgi:hypothetical protein
MLRRYFALRMQSCVRTNTMHPVASELIGDFVAADTGSLRSIILWGLYPGGDPARREETCP